MRSCMAARVPREPAGTLRPSLALWADSPRGHWCLQVSTPLNSPSLWEGRAQRGEGNRSPIGGSCPCAISPSPAATASDPPGGRVHSRQTTLCRHHCQLVLTTMPRGRVSQAVCYRCSQRAGVTGYDANPSGAFGTTHPFGRAVLAVSVSGGRGPAAARLHRYYLYTHQIRHRCRPRREPSHDYNR